MRILQKSDQLIANKHDVIFIVILTTVDVGHHYIQRFINKKS